jgi:hypothetical protein
MRVTCGPSTELIAKCPKCKAAVWSSNWSGVPRSTPAILRMALSMLSPLRGGVISSPRAPRFMAHKEQRTTEVMNGFFDKPHHIEVMNGFFRLRRIRLELPPGASRKPAGSPADTSPLICLLSAAAFSHLPQDGSVDHAHNAPPRRPRHLGWATPSPKPPKNLRLRRKIEGSCSPRRTVLRILPPGARPNGTGLPGGTQGPSSHQAQGPTAPPRPGVVVSCQ